MNSPTIKIISNDKKSMTVKNYGGDDEEIQLDHGDRMSLKIDLSMAEQFYYEVISSFEQEEVFTVKKYKKNYFFL